MFFLSKKLTTHEVFLALLRKIKYPKLILLILSIFIGYLIYMDGNNFYFHQIIYKLGYFGTFIAGFFFVYGFTTSSSIAILLVISPMQNFWLTGCTAFIGAFIGNILVFRAMRISVAGELNELSQNKLLKTLIEFLERHTPLFVRSHILPALAGFIAATPLPDELAVALVSWSKDISINTFVFFAFTFNVFGIFLILWIGKILQEGSLYDAIITSITSKF